MNQNHIRRLAVQPVQITLPMSPAIAASLTAGQNLLLSGPMLVARDAAHKRMIALIDAGEPLPFSIEGETLYYAGPSPALPGREIGSAGPTTSSRMDTYTPQLLERGLRCTIGKGKRSDAVVRSMVENSAVYLGVTGGAAALIANCVQKSELLCYEDLGPEAVRKIWVQYMPAVVLIDSRGENLYEIGKAQYAQPQNP